MTSPNKALKRFDLNVNVSTTLGPAGFHGVEGQCTTPEIVNTLVAMSNPFDCIGKTGQENTSPRNDDSSSYGASSLGSPAMSPPSVQHTYSQFIKESLKMTLKSKLKHSVPESKDEFDDFPSKRTKTDELTAEDEERRRKRRERNKIAATKCRLKKREKTLNLATESEVLSTQNTDLKRQIKDLKKEKSELEKIFSEHECMMLGNTLTTHPNLPMQPFDTFSEHCIDSDYIDNSVLISYNKDPNFGKAMEKMFFKTTRMRSDNSIRGGYCEDEDPDVYRPNGGFDFLETNDSAYSSFNSSSLDHGCRV